MATQLKVDPDRSSRWSPEERALREQLAAAYRIVAHFGWDDRTGTHISVRLPGPEHHFLINPYGYMFEEVTASSLVKIDLEGRPLEDTPYKVNPAGFTIHSAVHRARADALCVLHLHTRAGCAVAAQEGGLLPIHVYSILLQGRVGYHPFEGVAVNPDEQPRIVANLGRNDALILRNHGTLTVGNSIAVAFNWAYWLERACQIQIDAQAGGGALTMYDEQLASHMHNQMADNFSGFADMAWQALVRKMDRIDPSYKE